MKIFLDTALIDQIKQWQHLLDGITTNPTHLAHASKSPTHDIIEICKLLPQGDISVEVTEKDPQALYRQARALADLAENVIVKIPCLRQYYALIEKLQREGIRLNITLVFSLFQATLMAKMGVTYVSPFVGRLDDIDTPGTQLLYDIRAVFDHYEYTTQILAASIRQVMHIHEALLAGVDAITVPAEVLHKATQHPLSDFGAELFLSDWNKRGFSQFP